MGDRKPPQTMAEAFTGLASMERGIAERFRQMARGDEYRPRRMRLLAAVRTHRAYAKMFDSKARHFTNAKSS